MFYLNPNLEIKEEVLDGSIIYYIDDFYLYPEQVDEYLFGGKTPLHKIEEKPSYNTIHFEDRRLIKRDSRLENVVDFLSAICSQAPSTYAVVTNMQRFFDHEFNDYKNCIWWPHKDFGYNGIVYFNKGDNECGTNLYGDTTDELPDVPEHYQPWRPSEKYEILKVLEPKYNRLVFFDGFKFLHGADISNHRYFGEEYRKNQVFFFQR